MTDSDKLQILRSLRKWGGSDGINSAENVKAALDYAIQCCEATQSRAKTLRHDEITEPGVYLSKTAAGGIVPMAIRQELIDSGHVYKGLLYQGPVVEWVEE